MKCQFGIPNFLQDGLIELKFPGASTEMALVKGKIKFRESDNWTEEGRSREARNAPQESTPEDSVRRH